MQQSFVTNVTKATEVLQLRSQNTSNINLSRMVTYLGKMA